MRRAFRISVEMPPGSDVEMMTHYIWQAVANWSGGMDPEHPIGCQDVKPIVYHPAAGPTDFVVKEKQ